MQLRYKRGVPVEIVHAGQRLHQLFQFFAVMPVPIEYCCRVRVVGIFELGIHLIRIYRNGQTDGKNFDE
jgi:hypothetical protein